MYIYLLNRKSAANKSADNAEITMLFREILFIDLRVITTLPNINKIKAINCGKVKKFFSEENIKRNPKVKIGKSPPMAGATRETSNFSKAKNMPGSETKKHY